MKRSLIYLLIAITLAGVLGTLIAKDPGYVLISYGGASLQTGLWVMLAILLIVAGLLYYLLRLLRFVGQSASAIRSWRGDRSRARADKLTNRGLMYFQEGDYERAERFLNSGAKVSPNPAASFIYAAKAAGAQGKAEAREAYLRQAREADPEAKVAIAVASAEMAIARGEFGQALKSLDGTKPSDQVTRLRGQALLGMKDWQGLWNLMPELRGASPDGLNELQKRVAIERLSAADITDDACAAIYKKLPEEARREPEVAIAYINALADEANAEAAIRGILKQDWIPVLVARYGRLGRQTLAKRLKTAEGWQKEHPDDAALQLCLGDLYEAHGERDKARAAYQRSIDLKESPDANRQLGRLIAYEGDYQKSNEYLTRALTLGDGTSI